MNIFILSLHRNPTQTDAPQEGLAKGWGAEAKGLRRLFDRLDNKKMRERGNVVEEYESVVRLGHEY